MAVWDVGRMPVVARDAPKRITGIIRRGDIIKAYKIALSRQAEGQIDDSRLRLKRTDKMKFVDIVIQQNSQCISQTVSDVAPTLPYDCVLVSIRRHGTLMVPHGDTKILPGDIVSCFVRSADEERLHDCFSC
jgi:Trk K+ transport system NAD-binding subunit